MRTRIKELLVFLAPPVGWLVAFFLLPLLLVVSYSFCERNPYGGVLPHFSIASYAEVFNWLYLRILGQTVVTAAAVTALTLFLAYPIAYCMAFASPKLKALMMFLIIVPFWTNFMIRLCAMFALFGDNGWLNLLLLKLGLITEPLYIMNTSAAVYAGFLYWNLPFMVLPIFASLDRMDTALLEASMDLGAGKIATFFRITLPRSLPGVFAGIIFTFMPTAGNFVIPEMLGGPSDVMIGNIITSAFTHGRNWPFGAALSSVMMAAVMLLVVLYLRFAEDQQTVKR